MDKLKTKERFKIFKGIFNFYNWQPSSNPSAIILKEALGDCIYASITDGEIDYLSTFIRKQENLEKDALYLPYIMVLQNKRLYLIPNKDVDTFAVALKYEDSFKEDMNVDEVYKLFTKFNGEKIPKLHPQIRRVGLTKPLDSYLYSKNKIFIWFLLACLKVQNLWIGIQ